jgi:hypothetical protein
MEGLILGGGMAGRLAKTTLKGGFMKKIIVIVALAVIFLATVCFATDYDWATRYEDLDTFANQLMADTVPLEVGIYSVYLICSGSSLNAMAYEFRKSDEDFFTYNTGQLFRIPINQSLNVNLVIKVKQSERLAIFSRTASKTNNQCSIIARRIHD